MKFLDEKKRLFGVVNPVDLVAIVLAVALVAVLATMLFGKSPAAPVASKDQGTVEVVLLGDIEKYDTLQYEIGQEVSRLGGVGVMGTLESLEILPATREVFREDGTTIIVESQTSVQVRMVVRGEGTIAKDGASVGMERIRQNQLFDAQLPHIQATVRVVSVEQVD